MHDVYENPLITRYASKEMSEIFSDDTRYTLWRKLWIALAESEKELGLDISDEQIAQMKSVQDKIDYEKEREFEEKLRHDVMAHIHTFGTQAPLAMPIIHLGATSCFVTDNGDIIIYDNALDLIRKKLISTIKKLRNFALKYKDLPCLSYTHFQPAQLTTVGKRACLWLQDLLLDLESLDNLKKTVRLRGVKGTTGTQASFLDLFDGDGEKVKRLEKKVCEKMGYTACYAVTGQTYPRKFDYNVLSVLSQISQSAYKFANDIRLLQSNKEIEEPFEKTQVGSSAMAYKRNPMRSERICSLARYAESLAQNAAMTSSTQWLERTLDDSANRRIVMPQAFLTIDAILNLYLNVSENLVVYDKLIEKRVNAELPFMATENILMECVKDGGDRQKLHEKIRILSMKAGENVKVYGKENNLIDLIKSDDDFACVKDKLDSILDGKNFIGRSSEQVTDFIEEVDEILSDNSDVDIKGEVRV